MINPYIGRFVDGDGIAIHSKDLGDLHVSNDHVLLTEDGKTDASQSWEVLVSTQ